MSTSQHPVALRLERAVGGNGKLLAIVMGLPLIDGIFPALVLAGAVDDPIGVLQVGLLVFGGSATVAVILADVEGTPREIATMVALVGVPLVAIAAIEAALAPTLASVLDLVIFERFAALVIAAVAAKTASARIGEYLPRPAIIVALGLVASVDPAGAQLVLTADPTLVAHGAGAALVGVLFALAVAVSSPILREQVDIDRFRFGSAVALGLLPLSLLGLPYGHAPLAVLALTTLFALDPSWSRGVEEASSWRSSVSQSLADGGYEREDEQAGEDGSESYPDGDSTADDGPAPWM